uniref:Uncharacterized protein n=1 Tax=Octopus bimaculoides TaxID=37653 RepID=A0A0L8GPM2_OCTBM
MIQEDNVKEGILTPSDVILTAYGGTRIPQLGKTTITGTHKGKIIKCSFYVTRTEGPAILGLDTCQKLNIVSINGEVKAAPSRIDRDMPIKNTSQTTKATVEAPKIRLQYQIQARKGPDIAQVVSRAETPRSYIIETESGRQLRRNRAHIRPRLSRITCATPAASVTTPTRTTTPTADDSTNRIRVSTESSPQRAPTTHQQPNDTPQTPVQSTRSTRWRLNILPPIRYR